LHDLTRYLLFARVSLCPENFLRQAVVARLNNKKDIRMEGTLFASSISDGFAIGSPEGPVLIAGQVVELLVDDEWIAGQIVNKNSVDNKADKKIESTPSVSSPNRTSDRATDSVTEASEESFPASDPPAWTDRREDAAELDSSAKLSGGYNFQASANGKVYELREGMQVRTSELSSDVIGANFIS
jgi:hypothetical protein